MTIFTKRKAKCLCVSELLFLLQRQIMQAIIDVLPLYLFLTSALNVGQCQFQRNAVTNMGDGGGEGNGIFFFFWVGGGSQ